MKKPARSIPLTSTLEPRWQEECQWLVTRQHEFELRDLRVSHRDYCVALARQHGWQVNFRKIKARFIPPPPNPLVAELGGTRPPEAPGLK